MSKMIRQWNVPHGDKPTTLLKLLPPPPTLLAQNMIEKAADGTQNAGINFSSSKDWEDRHLQYVLATIENIDDDFLHVGSTEDFFHIDAVEPKTNWISVCPEWSKSLTKREDYK